MQHKQLQEEHLAGRWSKEETLQWQRGQSEYWRTGAHHVAIFEYIRRFFPTKLHNNWNGSVPVSLSEQNAGCQQTGYPAHLLVGMHSISILQNDQCLLLFAVTGRRNRGKVQETRTQEEPEDEKK